MVQAGPMAIKITYWHQPFQERLRAHPFKTGVRTQQVFQTTNAQLASMFTTDPTDLDDAEWPEDMVDDVVNRGLHSPHDYDLPYDAI
jgi:hypothetical protein